MDTDVLWSTTFAGNSLGAWAIAALIAMGAIVGLRLAARTAARQVQKWAHRTANQIDDIAAELVERTHLLFFIVVAFWVASYALTLSARGAETIRVMLVLAVLIQSAIWTSAIGAHVLASYRRRVDGVDAGAATAMGALGFAMRVAIWGAVLLIALDTLGVDITALIAGLGVGGIAVALAVQNVLGDLFASVSIVLDKPFVVGDFIVLGEHMGVVENVGLKTTRIRSLSGEELVIANSDLLASRIRNFKRMTERRVVFEVGVVYGTPSEKLRRIPDLARAAIESRDNTRFDRSHFKAFGDSALLFETVYYMTVPDYAAYMETQQAINLELYERFEAEGLQFAYPTQTLFVRPELALASV